MIKMCGIICNKCRVVIRPVREDDSGNEHYCDRCKVGEPWLRGATDEYLKAKEDGMKEDMVQKFAGDHWAITPCKKCGKEPTFNREFDPHGSSYLLGCECWPWYRLGGYMDIPAGIDRWNEANSLDLSTFDNQ